MSPAPSGGGGAEVRAREVVGGVLAEALRARGCGGIVIAAGPCNERDLLVRWAEAAGIATTVPDEDRVRAVAEALVPPGEPVGDGAEAAFAVASAVARARGALLVGVETRTHLLLDGARARVLPLGDLSASTVGAWGGGVRPVLALGTAGAAWLEPVDRALEGFLDDGLGLEEALRPLPAALRTELERILRLGAPDASAPLVPKLGRWTAGLDLAL